MANIRPRERAAIIQSLRAGVTPRTGLEYIQVGRVNEVKALIEDIDNIIQGGSAFRMVIGDFGAGKSFFLQLIRYIGKIFKLKLFGTCVFGNTCRFDCIGNNIFWYSHCRGKAVAERDKQLEAAKQEVQGSSNASSGVQNAKVKSATKKKYRPKKKRK